MSDAIRQLHDVANALADNGLRTVKTNDLCVAVYGAADEIERLRAENARLREALRMAMADTPGWYDAARAALAEQEPK